MDRTIRLEPASRTDLGAFAQMERASDTYEYVSSYSITKHEEAFSATSTIYLKISENSQLVGFFILVLENDRQTIEFRRVVIAINARGIGQQAITLMEHYCRDQLGVSRIWLDVFEKNSRARHVYEKLGYRRFDIVETEVCGLIFYEKRLTG